MPFNGSQQTSLQPFDFQARTRVVFGPGTLGRLGDLVREVGGERAILVSDAGIRAAGHVDRALQSLEAASIRTVVYEGVEENPTTRHVESALEVARNHRIDFIVGLGGGTVTVGGVVSGTVDDNTIVISSTAFPDASSSVSATGEGLMIIEPVEDGVAAGPSKVIT